VIFTYKWENGRMMAYPVINYIVMEMYMSDYNVVHKKETCRCPFCQSVINPDDFRDERSRREFFISGLCQKCQDETFGK